MKNGSTSKPTPRSETARLRSNVFRGFGNDEVFVKAWIVTLLKMMAVTVIKTLKTQLTMYHDLRFSSSVPVVWYSKNSSQTGFIITLYVFNPYGVSLMLNNPCELLDYPTHFKNDKFDKLFSYTSIT